MKLAELIVAFRAFDGELGQFAFCGVDSLFKFANLRFERFNVSHSGDDFIEPRRQLNKARPEQCGGVKQLRPVAFLLKQAVRGQLRSAKARAPQ